MQHTVAFDSKTSKIAKKEKYFVHQNIEGVKILPLNYIPTEDGYFLELFRLKKGNSLEIFPEFKVQQVSVSSLEPGGVKAWHVHTLQDDIWFVPPNDRLLVGLQDTREASRSKGNVMRLVLGASSSFLLYIPRGVAHGCSNNSLSALTLFYITNRQFNKNDPDEYRLPWDNLGKDFWNIKKG